MKKRILSSLLILAFVAGSYFILNKSFLNQTEQKYDLKTSKGLKAYLFEQKKKNKYKLKYDNPDKAMAEEIAIRSEIDKPYAYKMGWRFKAQQAAKKNVHSMSLHKTSALEWVERGPGNFGGRSRSLVVHPGNDNIWWVGAVGGGIWKTTNSGNTWTCLTDHLPVLSVCALDICISSPDILYAGTGEGFYNGDAVIGDGIFKTTDGGNTWQQLGSTASNTNFRYVNRIIVDPDNPDIVLAATNRGLYRSVNGGDSWTEVFSIYADERYLRVQQILANPLNFNTQFIAVDGRGDTGTYPGGIFKSTDGGQSWSKVSEEIVNHHRIEMAISEADTNVLYAAPVNSDYGLLGFFRSPDAGDTWINYGNSTNWLGGQGWYDNALIVSPLDENIIFVGGIDVYRVTISGASMTTTKLTHWYSGAGYPYVHADQHFFVTIQASSSNFSIIAANDGGVHFSTNKGVSWQELNNNYNVTQYYDADRHPTSPEFLGGTQDNGSHRSPVNPDYATSWDEVLGGDGFDCAWNKENANIAYTTLYYTQIYKSTDGGYNYSYVNNGMPESSIFHTPLEMDPSNSDKLFTAGNDNYIYWTDNAASNWHGVIINNNDYTRCKIAVSKSNSDIVWAGGTTIYINVSTNGGLSFNQVNQPAGSPHAWLTGISVHPTEDSTAFLTIGSSGYGKIYKTRDLGQTWENINNNLPDAPVHTVLVMPFNKNEIWIGTDIGLFISYDEGQSWQYSDNGIPATAIRRLKIVGTEIVAATHGRGIWSIYREELAQGPLLAPTLFDITVPNPNTNQLKLRFHTNYNYDSVLVYVNGQLNETLGALNAGIDTLSVYSTNPMETITVHADGYLNGNMEASEEKSRTIYAAVETLTENFNTLETTFFGDLYAAETSGFSTALLDSSHPYENGADHTGYLGTPIIIKSGAALNYSDVAIVEPGDPGSAYPDENMRDYVTVEGTNDGDNWEILVTPYDARFNSSWQEAYDNSGSGNESMMQNHYIDLTLHYPIDEKIYLRYRLFADANTNAWGWAIDDVQVTNCVSSTTGDRLLVNKFKLIGNFPNPFNPSTTIRFTLEKDGPVSLHIYNNLGQLVKALCNNVTLTSGAVHQKIWDGRNESGQQAASGTYYYELTSGEKVTIKKMVLIR
jgi:photosystem II stability/assembly factor-like uncharacterized protein